MKPFGTALGSCVLALWVFATLAHCQGGSFGWLPGYGDGLVTCNGTSANLTSYNMTNFVGCMDLGLSATSQPFGLTNNSTVVTMGTGVSMPPFNFASYGPSSFPGFPTNGNSTWTTMETHLNCSIVCRAHGMKYAIILYGSCACSPYIPYNSWFVFNLMIRPQWKDSTLATGLIPNPISACCPLKNGTTYGQFGDNTQYYTGADAGTLANAYTYNQSALYTGHTATAVWVDITFASDSTLVLSTQATLYQYLACFIMSDSTTTFMPLGFINNFTLPSQCYTFCAGVNMPYAGMTYQGGSL